MYTCTGQKNGNVRVPSRPGMLGPAGLVTLSWVRPASFYLQYFRLSVCFIPKDRHLAGELQPLYLVIYRMPVITAAGRRSKLGAGEVSAQSFPWAARGPSNQAE